VSERETGERRAGGIRFRLHPPAAGLLLGLLTGIADWIVVANDWGHSQSGMWYLPPFVWLPVIWTSVTICCLAGIIVSWARFGRLRGVALVFAGPGLLLLSRGATPFREWSGLPAGWTLAVWLGVTLVLSVPLVLLPMAAARALPLWIAGTAGSVVVLTVLAADADFTFQRTAIRGQVPSVIPKNVALIFLDTVRYDDALGERGVMPNLAAFARSANRFDNVWAPAPWTIPSHFAVLSGVDPWMLPAEDARRPGIHYDGPMLAQRFRAQGYDTAAVLANPLLGNPDFSRGYDRFTYSRASGVCRSALGELLNRSYVRGGPRSPLCGWFLASEVTSRALRFVRRVPRSQPYFLTVNYLDTHYPYYVPPECRDASFRPLGHAERESLRRSTPAAPASAAVLQRAHEQYRAAMRCLDRSLGTLLTELAGDPNTIVAVVGDHGEQFGEHGLVEHGNSVYRQVLHVPLVIHGTGVQPSEETEAASITDLYKSLLTTAPLRDALEWNDPQKESLRPTLSSYETSTSGKREGAFSVARGEYHYIVWSNGREALFNDAADPNELAPISTRDAAGATIAAPLRELAARAAAARQRLNEFRALGYLR
jgi:arylsulfatase A-like enzyme